MTEYTLAEFFAGTGAFSLGFEVTKKVKTIYANDSCKNSEKVYNENFNTKLVRKDIHDLKLEEIPKMDILTAGFPCQPFSIAGEQKGFNDERSNTFWKLIKIIEHHKPEIIIFENVKNLQSHDDGKTFKTIISEIEKLEYHYKYQILNTCIHSTIPQNRERIYIICFRNKNNCDNFNFPTPIDINEKLKIQDMFEQNVPDKYYYTKVSNIWTKLVDDVKTKNTIYQYRRYYVRENKSDVCPTLTANMGTGGHNVPIIKDDKGIRKLTPRECFNLQGFPSDFQLPNISDSGLYHLAGNAITMLVGKLIAIEIRKILVVPIEKPKVDKVEQPKVDKVEQPKVDKVKQPKVKQPKVDKAKTVKITKDI